MNNAAPSSRGPRRKTRVHPAIVRSMSIFALLTVASARAAEGLPVSDDAAARWPTPHAGVAPLTCPADAAQRWQVPDIAVADLPHSADAAEHWLTQKILIRDLPHTADAAEHWLCAP